MSALPSPSGSPVPAAPPVTNGRLASALLALASAEDPLGRRAAEYRAAARTLRQLGVDLCGRRVAVSSLPGVSPRAADAIAAFLASGSDENVGDALAAMLDRADPAAPRKADFLTRADVDRILSVPSGIAHADLRGDAHLHTDRSDGRMPLGALHRALEARGDAYALLTDHARDCAVAGGLFPADFRAQRREVDALNARAAERGVAIELNGCPERLDLPPALARIAVSAGCLFSISSDAHAAAHLSFLDYGLAVARLAGVPPDRVVNTWSRDRFADWLEERRAG